MRTKGSFSYGACFPPKLVTTPTHQSAGQMDLRQSSPVYICVFLEHRCFSFIQPGSSFSPFFFRGGCFGEVGTPTIVSENKKEAEVGGGSTAHPPLTESVAFLRVRLILQGVNQRADA